MSDVLLADTVYFHFGTSDPSTGEATNADSLPTVTIEEDGTAMGYSPTVTNVATGLYRVTVVATAGNGFETGKRYSAYAVATVSTKTGRDGIFEFAVYTRGPDDLATTVQLTDVHDTVDDIHNDVGSIDGRIPAALVNARIPAYVGEMANNVITAASIAAGAITSSEAPALGNLDVAVSSRAVAGDSMALTSAAVDAILDETVEGSYTFRQMLRIFFSSLALKTTGGGTATITFRDAADSKNRITATVDVNNNRTAITLDGT